MQEGAVQRDHNSRVLMLGVDAMSLPFARAHLDQLPNLKALIERGVLIEPETPGPYFSASAWPTFVSGKSVGDHGQYFPFQWDGEHLMQRRLFDPVWRETFYLKPFWHEFSRDGISSTVLDAGFVQNDREAPCLQISNWSHQDTARADASDPSILAEIRKRFGHRPIGREIPVPKSAARCAKIRNRTIASLERKIDAILWLMKQSDWQFFLAGIYELHRAGHNLWPIDGAFASKADSESLIEVYKAFDSQMSRILKATDDGRTTVIVFALHGMGPNNAQDHFLPKILAKLNALYLRQHGFPGQDVKRESLMSRLRKTVPYSLQYLIADILGERVQDWVVNRAVVGGHVWLSTPAFPVSSGGEGFLRLNVKGREAKGFFEPDSVELQQYVQWLEDALLKIRVSDTDEPLIRNIVRTKEHFPGQKSHFLPDLLPKWAPSAPVERIYSDEIGEIREKLRTGRGGNHAGGSFVLVTGPGALNPALKAVTHIKEIGKFVHSCFEPFKFPRAMESLNAPDLEDVN